MRKPNLISLLTIAALLCFLGCKKEPAGPVLNLNAPVNISVFEVTGAKSAIDTGNGTILLQLPFGTDFTKVTPAITVPSGASITPTSGTVVDLSKAVLYRVINGNVYKDYAVTAQELPAISSFKAQGIEGVIDEVTRTIKVIVPPGSDMTKITVTIALATGATVSPATGNIVNFTNPVVFTVKTSIASVPYTVTAIDANADKPVAFLGNYDNRDLMSNSDEKAAADWLFATYSNKAEFVSINAIKNGTANLAKYGVIWWHHDATQTLPDITLDDAVVKAIKAYRAGGGNLLLTTFASRWVEALGIVPPFKGPNNVFGDNIGGQRQDGSNNWGVSINKDQVNHPIFSGLPLAADKTYPVVYLLDKSAFRLNHVSWWKVNEWGNYGDAAGWRSQTGGIDLAGPDGSDNTNSNITIAEFPKGTGHGATIVFTSGSYDWYAEPNPANNTPSPANTFLDNVKKLTRNSVEYLKKQ